MANQIHSSLSKAAKGSAQARVPGPARNDWKGPTTTTSQLKASKTSEWITIWGAGHNKKKTLWELLRAELPQSTIRVILKLDLVTQKRDNRRRLDMFVETGRAKQVIRQLRAKFPHWHTREHRPYSTRQHEVARPVGAPNRASWCRVASMNVNGINNKREHLSYWLEQDKIDVICIQEHMRDQFDWKLRLPGFRCFSAGADADIVGSRGVAVLVRNDMPAYEKIVSHNMVLVEVLIGTTRVLIGSVYIPSPKAAHASVWKSTAAAVKKEVRAGTKVMLLGDFNVERTKIYKKLLSSAIDLTLLDVNGESGTWHRCAGRRSTAIDHILVSSGIRAHCSPATVLRSWDFSDHYAIMTDLDIPSSEGELTPPPRSRRIAVDRILKNAGASDRCRQSNRYAVLLQDLPDNPDEEELDKLVCGFIKATAEIAEDESGPAPRKPRHDAFVSRQARALIRRRSILHGAWNRTAIESIKDPDCASKLEQARSDELQYHLCASKATALIRSEKQKRFRAYVNQAVEMARSNQSKKMFHWIKTITTGRRLAKATPIQSSENGELLMDHADIQNAWASHFARIASDPKGLSSNVEYWELLIPRSRDLDELPHINDDISWKEVQGCLLSMSRGKAPGDSGIPVEWLMLACEPKPERNASMPSSHLGRIILTMISHMFDKAMIPDSLRTSILVPIPKKGDLTDPDNYRGISLMESVLKLLCTLVNRRLASALESECRICKEQAGFRKHEEGMAQVTSLFEICERRKAEGLATYLLFVDFSKAYDTVPHAGVLRKLENLGVKGRMLKFIQQLLFTSSFRVKAAGGLSIPVLLERGLPQGNAISCIAFDVFINDIGLDSVADRIRIPGVSERIGELAFADDLVIFASSRQMLCKRANRLSKWASDHGMSFGIKKCGVMVHNALKSSHLAVKLGKQVVPCVNEYTYLGVLINDALELRRVVEARKASALSTLFTLRPLLRASNIPVHLRLQVIKSILSPVVNYGGELLGFNEALVKPLQSVMNRALKLALGMKEESKCCSPSVLYRQSNVPPVFVSMSAMRLRAYIKFPSLRTWASILSAEKALCRGTWHSLSAQYLKREAKALANSTASERVEDLKALLWQRTEKRKVVLGSSSWTNYNPLLKTSNFVNCITRDASVSAGIPLLAAMRCGATWTAQRAAQARLIDTRWKRRCPACLKRTPETIFHILFKCKHWALQRKRMTRAIKSTMRRANIKLPRSPRPPPQARLTLLLGGTADGFSLSPVWEEGWSNKAGGTQHAPLFTHVATFLASINVERSACLWRHYEPTKSPILEGTAALLSASLGPDDEAI